MTTIKEARLNAGLKQEELAMKSGVKLSTLQTLERGASNITGAPVEPVLRLAHTLGVTVEDLAKIEW